MEQGSSNGENMFISASDKDLNAGDKNEYSSHFGRNGAGYALGFCHS
jgi:hypothetical protein|tara:strand:+ start:916 stop:1056 length:141 start_codon:yes stop_codon:yes gene_type:complete